MNALDYTAVRMVHIAFAATSVGLFTARASLQLGGMNWRQWPWLCIAPHVNDTLLLAAGITLALASRQYPLAQPWLTAKLVALAVYVVLGKRALRADAPRRERACAFAAALASVGYIVAVAITRSPDLRLL